MAERDQQHWTLDKRVPIALIITLAAQFGGVVWWGSSISSRVDHLERQAPIRDDVIEVKVKLQNIERAMIRFETLLDRRQSLKTDMEQRDQ